jgi:hypothetical protein
MTKLAYPYAIFRSDARAHLERASRDEPPQLPKSVMSCTPRARQKELGRACPLRRHAILSIHKLTAGRVTTI